jgi:hypothetical protein
MHTPSTIFGVVAGLALFTASGLASPATDISSGWWVSGVDMIDLCHFQYGDGYNPEVRGNDAYAWRCSHNGIYYGCDIAAWCRHKFGDSAYADPQGGGVNDWACYKN